MSRLATAWTFLPIQIELGYDTGFTILPSSVTVRDSRQCGWLLADSPSHDPPFEPVD